MPGTAASHRPLPTARRQLHSVGSKNPSASGAGGYRRGRQPHPETTRPAPGRCLGSQRPPPDALRPPSVYNISRSWGNEGDTHYALFILSNLGVADSRPLAKRAFSCRWAYRFLRSSRSAILWTYSVVSMPSAIWFATRCSSPSCRDWSRAQFSGRTSYCPNYRSRTTGCDRVSATSPCAPPLRLLAVARLLRTATHPTATADAAHSRRSPPAPTVFFFFATTSTFLAKGCFVGQAGLLAMFKLSACAGASTHSFCIFLCNSIWVF